MHFPRIPADTDAIALASRVRAFVCDKVLTYEKDARNTAHGPTDALRRELNALARAEGLLAPHVSREYGGLGLSHAQRAPVFEAAGYSPLGPVALHCAAPDKGNMHLLEQVASPAQKRRFLESLARADSRSCFAMTEPAPGAGSDPLLLQTTAVGDGRDFVVNGRKWVITGAPGAACMILMARTFVSGRDLGATMFLVPLPNADVRVERLVDSMDSSFTEGHAEVVIQNLQVRAEDILGELAQGFRYAQVRLAPARLTHCMRWIGAAARAQDIALAHAATRQAFGKSIGRLLAPTRI